MERRSNRRKYLRLYIKVEIPAIGKPIGAWLLDISQDGAFIEMPSLLKVSTLLLIEFRLPDSRPQNIFRLYAKVVRRTAAGIGVSFLKMPSATLHALAMAVSQQPADDSAADAEREPTQGFSLVWVA